jgi:hypothetical protein
MDFAEKGYLTLYEEHLEILEEWQAHVRGRTLLPHLQQHLHDEAW